MPERTQATEKDSPQIPLSKKLLNHATGFINKFNNDWTMQSAGTLAYNLMVAILPIVIAIIAALGFIASGLGYDARTKLINDLKHIFPLGAADSILQLALNALSRNSGWLSLIAICLAFFGGSRLFITIEGCFAITYRTYSRGIIAQNIMAFLMMILFVILIPVMVFTSSVPALIASLTQTPVLRDLPILSEIAHNGIFLGIMGVLVGLFISWMLFEAIFLFVPNQKISLRNSWGGALISAILLELFLALFPLYIAHFMGSYTGTVGFAVILLVFFYYFAVILLLGAEVNAYFAEGVPPLPNNLAATLRDATMPETRPAPATKTEAATPAPTPPATEQPVSKQDEPEENASAENEPEKQVESINDSA